MSDIIEATQISTNIHNSTLQEWVKGYRDLVQHQDAQQGYYFMLAKKQLGSTFEEFSREIGVSTQTVVKKIKLYKDIKELEQVAPDKELPKSSQQHGILKGDTPEQKADNYAKVKRVTDTPNPTTKQIKAVMQTVCYCCVYLISDGTYTKIGITENVLRRLKQLQTGNPHKLEVIYESIYSSFSTAGKVEVELHHKYRAYRVLGEWFNLTQTQIKEITC